jgi:serpin B
LNRLGVRRAFDMERAEFGGITKDGPLFLDQVVHQAYVRVDEKGTEAAAATGVIGGFGGVAPPPRRVVFRADHPFVFLIYDQRTRSILFLGRVMTPWDE